MTSPFFGLARLGVIKDKLGWGLRVVGPLAVLRGAWRFGRVWLSRPKRAEVHLRSGPILEFDYPHQFPSTLMLFGDFIDPEFAFLVRIAQPHWHIVDVGAAIGQFSMFAAVCLPGAMVHAFEPSGANVATLRRNIARNGAGGRVVVHQAALSDRRETAHFSTAPKNWMSQLSDAQGADAPGELVEVDTLAATLPRLGLDHVDILKVNVAGFEPAVLEGAMPSLAAGKVDMMILLLGIPSLAHYAAMAGLGYRFFYYHPRQQTLFEVTRFDQDSVLAHRPWPARHIIAIRGAALDGLVAGRVAVRPLTGRGEESAADMRSRRRWVQWTRG